jgi:MOB kinase activator 1
MSALLSAVFGRSKQATFMPLKRFPGNHRCHQLQQLAEGTLSSPNIRASVKLRPNGDLMEWLCTHVAEFYNEISIIVAPADDFCTAQTCPEMRAGPAYRYLWKEHGKKAVDIPAIEYIRKVLQWVDHSLNDPKLFPSDPESPFPPNCIDMVKEIFKRLFRIYAHLYHHHREDMRNANAEDVMNKSFRHFIFFVQEFKLIPEDQLEPLRDLIVLL